MRTQAEWNVETHIALVARPIRRETRERISSAALFVNVIARIDSGETLRSRMRWAMRWVRTRVFPDPAPATTRTGPSGAVTASRCAGVRAAREACEGWAAGTPRC